jgi:hypothetical protein
LGTQTWGEKKQQKESAREGVGKVLGRCWEGVGKVLGRCWAGVGKVLGKVLGRCWAGVGKVLGKVLGRCWESVGKVLGRCWGGVDVEDVVACVRLQNTQHTPMVKKYTP